MAEGEIVGRAADVEIISHIKFGGEGIVIGMDDVIVDEYDVVVILMRWAPVVAEWW